MVVSALCLAAAAGCAATAQTSEVERALSIRHVRLADSRLAATPGQRHLLSYLVSCALPETVALDARTERSRFAARWGWRQRGPTAR
jgi:hypothetical protein